MISMPGRKMAARLPDPLAEALERRLRQRGVTLRDLLLAIARGQGWPADGGAADCADPAARAARRMQARVAFLQRQVRTLEGRRATLVAELAALRRQRGAGAG